MNVEFKGSRFLFQSDFLWSVEFHLRTREDFVSERLREFSEIKPEIHTRALRLFLSIRTGWLARCMRTKMGHLILHTFMCACVCVCVCVCVCECEIVCVCECTLAQSNS